MLVARGEGGGTVLMVQTLQTFCINLLFISRSQIGLQIR